MIAAAALAFAGCAKEVAKVDDAPKADGKTMTFKVSVEDPIMDAETKATLGRDGVFAWKNEDQVAFINSSGSIAAAGTISGDEVTVNSGDYVYAIYPMSAHNGLQKIAYNNQTGPIVVAQVTAGKDLTFYHIASLVNIKVSGVTVDSSIEFAASGASSCGANFSFDTDGVPTLSGSDFTYPLITTGKYTPEQLANGVTISVPNVSYADGFTVGIKAGNRFIYKKEASAKAKYSQLATRGTLLNMKALDYVPSSKFYVGTTSSWWNQQDVRMIQSEASKYETWMNIDGGADIYIYDEYNIGNVTNGYLSKLHVDDGNTYQIAWDGTDGSVTYKSSTQDQPFWNEGYPVNEMAISGDFNSWGDTNFTYNGNLNWSLTGLAIVTSGSYKFKIRKSGVWQYQAGINSGLGSSLLYGTLKSDTGDASVYLESGTYNVHMCATSDWQYLIMFEKQ